MNETLFNQKVKRRLLSYPRAWAIKVQMVALRGVPDILACVQGRLIALEGKVNDRDLLKSAGRHVLQRQVIHKINRAGGFAAFITPKTFDSVFKQLDIYLNEAQNPACSGRKNH